MVSSLFKHIYLEENTLNWRCSSVSGETHFLLPAEEEGDTLWISMEGKAVGDQPYGRWPWGSMSWDRLR